MRRNAENIDVRQMITAAGLFDWQCARRIGISPSTLVIWLREPLPEGSERRQRILSALSETEGGDEHGTKEGGQ